MSQKFSGPLSCKLASLFALLLLAACATGTIREKVLTMPVIEGASYVGQETCLGCHENKSASFTHNVHGRLADFELMGAQKGCESCHGPGSLHVDGGGDTAKILRPLELKSEETAAICAKCHTDGELMDWTFSEHALADLSCTDCHSMHAENSGKAYLKQTGTELCYSCHQEQRAKANLPSHHPVAEGKMSCNDCHNPHGELATDEQARDLCLNCHSRYQGPFVFEHAPVEEDCSICHDPHGTVANNLLQQNEPFLCLQCHESHFHAARIGGTVDVGDTFTFDGNKLDELRSTNLAAYDWITNDASNGNPVPGTALTPAASNSFLTGLGLDPVTVPFTNTFGADGWRKGFLTKCTTCHSVVHGSDLPSQSAPVTDSNGDAVGSGHGLTR
ncbi:GSU2203 family decaheme c-type cytochrome [Malonomonas rubra]|uniref:GSU2203 family decaheme c-type cytochrome n=1 Tax=Malonomonas rubra TaxID=57040 RepID=UPI0026ED71A9|nr:GSU2203 family decaheme c-type cytochrome [Malonomonas rubra]